MNYCIFCKVIFRFFFFNDTATTEIYTLSLHDALPIISCTIIVTDANDLTRPIHGRMPVVLDQADIGPWLNGEVGTELLKPAGDDRIQMWPVSRRVNKTG